MIAKSENFKAASLTIVTMIVLGWFLAGCAPLLIAGGAAGGYAVAKDMDDGELIDNKK